MLQVRSLLASVTTVVLLLLLGVNTSLAAPHPAKGTQCPDLSYSWNNVTIVAGGFITGIVPSYSNRGVMYVRTDISE